MKHFQSSHWLRSATRSMSLGACFFPSLLLAHPGHYHPDETDEFDFLRSMFLHSHGTLDWVLICVAATSLVVAVLAVRPALRLSAMALGLSSLAIFSTL